jgi:hypothetical protein
MPWFHAPKSPQDARHAALASLRWRRRLHSLAFRTNMAMAGAIAIILVGLPHTPPASGVAWLDTVAVLVARDPLVRKVLWVAAGGIWLTAVLFFQGPRLHRRNNLDRGANGAFPLVSTPAQD